MIEIVVAVVLFCHVLYKHAISSAPHTSCDIDMVSILPMRKTRPREATCPR